jgi:hypothetical protein
MATTTTQSLFVTGDVVLANPKESAALFAAVVVLSVLLENVLGVFRQHKSRFVKLLFLQISEEIMIVGVLGMLLVFTLQSIENMPPRWAVMLRWIQIVLFFFVMFFITRIVIVASVSQKVIQHFRSFDEAVAQGELEVDEHGVPQAVHLSSFQRCFFVLRHVFRRQADQLEAFQNATRDKRSDTMMTNLTAASPSGATVGAGSFPPGVVDDLGMSPAQRAVEKKLKKKHAAAAAAAAASPNGILERFTKKVLLVDYLQQQSQDTVVKFTDITWQCWFSLIFLAAFNSVRMFVLPGRLQSKPVSEYTVDDRVKNTMSYIFIIGWIPAVVYGVAFALLCRNFYRYIDRAEQSASGQAESEALKSDGTSGKAKGNVNSGVWLPPKQLTAQLMGRSFDDPCTYLLRGNRTYTLHMLKVPALMIELYFAMFAVGQWGQISATFGVRQVFILPLMFLPVAFIMATLPIGVLLVSILTSLGTRLNEPAVIRLALAKARSEGAITGAVSGAESQGTELAAIDDLALTIAGGSGDRPSGEMAGQLERIEALLQNTVTANLQRAMDVDGGSAEATAKLRARVAFLEDLCVAHGVPILNRDAAPGGGGNDASLATLCTSMAALQQQNSRLAEQQQLLLNQSRGSGGGGGGLGGHGSADFSGLDFNGSRSSLQLPTSPGHVARGSDGGIVMSDNARQLQAVVAARQYDQRPLQGVASPGRGATRRHDDVFAVSEPIGAGQARDISRAHDALIL